MAKEDLSQIYLFPPFFYTGESICLKTVVDDTSITFDPVFLCCDWHLLLEVNYAIVDLAKHSRPRASFYERRRAWSTATTRWRRHPESERWYEGG